MYILTGIDPDFRSHDGDEQVRGFAAHRRHRDTLSLEVRDATDAFVTEQSEAACMDAGQDRDRDAAINRGRQGRRKIQSEIQPTAADRLRKVTRAHRDIANIGKTLGAQQFADDPHRSDTYPAQGGFRQTDRWGFGGSLGGQRRRTRRRPAAPANDSIVRKRRRVCVIDIRNLPLP